MFAIVFSLMFRSFMVLICTSERIYKKAYICFLFVEEIE